jgi:ADP-heptose:LPS heptosyltransferase
LPQAVGLWLRLLAAGIPARIVRLDRSFSRLRSALACADLALGCDSGPMHYAALLGTPTVVIYGPYRAAEFGPRWRSCGVEPVGSGQPATRVSTARVLAAVLSLVVPSRSSAC